mmetsp:Transcript_27433/g.47608  ORF Transcript_27433/g.47608 Transcript_27433/m.47608 type:complete len:221 (-) Transcript_27433:575-1237(-)
MAEARVKPHRESTEGGGRLLSGQFSCLPDERRHVQPPGLQPYDRRPHSVAVLLQPEEDTKGAAAASCGTGCERGAIVAGASAGLDDAEECAASVRPDRNTCAQEAGLPPASSSCWTASSGTEKTSGAESSGLYDANAETAAPASPGDGCHCRGAILGGRLSCDGRSCGGSIIGRGFLGARHLIWWCQQWTAKVDEHDSQGQRRQCTRHEFLVEQRYVSRR